MHHGLAEACQNTSAQTVTGRSRLARKRRARLHVRHTGRGRRPRPWKLAGREPRRTHSRMCEQGSTPDYPLHTRHVQFRPHAFVCRGGGVDFSMRTGRAIAAGSAWAGRPTITSPRWRGSICFCLSPMLKHMSTFSAVRARHSRCTSYH